MRKYFLFFFIGYFILSSCSKRDEQEYYFIGDSLIEYWDLSYYMPTYLSNNLGKVGAKIEDINPQINFEDNDVTVLLIGTNNLTNNVNILGEDFQNEIKEEFKIMLTSINCNRIIIVSILPRKDRESQNIKSINERIKELTLEDDRLYFLDVFDDFTRGDKINLEFYTDGLHLSRNGYSLLTNKLIKFLN